MVACLGVVLAAVLFWGLLEFGYPIAFVFAFEVLFAAIWALIFHYLLEKILPPDTSVDATGNLVSSENKILRENAALSAMAVELEDMRDQAESANIAKSEFLAIMSHELRTPISGVIGMVDLLGETRLTKKQMHYVETLRRSGDTLLSVINSILDFSKLDAGQVTLEKKDIKLADLVDDIITTFTPQCDKKGIQLTAEIEDNVPDVIVVDPTRLRQIFYNLVGNAVKFTEEGTISVKVYAQPQTTGVIKFEIMDTGIGISPSAQRILFTKFSQADTSITRKYGGTGLGLSICKKLATLMGGDIGVISAEGEGSLFWFTIFAKKGDVENVGDRNVTYGGRLTDMTVIRPLNILVAEDNEINQEIIKAILGGVGHILTIANNGEEAISMLEKTAFDVVLMDVFMPVLGGVDATKWIRATEKGGNHLPIIGCTADAFPDQIIRYKKVGMDEMVIKPINQMELFAAINRVMGEDIHHFNKKSS